MEVTVMLHNLQDIKYNLNDPLYGRFSAAQIAPKFKMPDEDMDGWEAYKLVSSELVLDGHASLNLATFCQTWADEAIHKLMNNYVINNMVEKDEYQQNAAIEERCVHMLADLWNSHPVT